MPETEAESILVVPTYPQDQSVYKVPKTVPCAENKYLGGLSNILPYM
jgi:hypothetical protein